MFNERKKGATVNKDINTKVLPYVALKDLVGTKEPIQIWGYIFTTGKYGKQVMVVTEDSLINMPKWAVAEFEEFDSNADYKAAILDGKCAIADIKNIETKNGTTVSYTCVDFE